jgi:hypothetical protein
MEEWLTLPEPDQKANLAVNVHRGLVNQASTQTDTPQGQSFLNPVYASNLNQ